MWLVGGNEEAARGSGSMGWDGTMRRGRGRRWGGKRWEAVLCDGKRWGVERRRGAEKRKEAVGNDGGQKMEDGGKGTVGHPSRERSGAVKRRAGGRLWKRETWKVV